jgi:putative SOS response-associated peptidase YedK
VDGFYEWRRIGKERQPYRVFRPDGRPLALAGLWSGWRNPETGEIRRTFTIVTTTPSTVVAELHDRMPVIVPDEAWARWLDPRPAEPGELRALLEPSDDIELEIAPASRLVNDVRHDGPELLLALD